MNKYPRSIRVLHWITVALVCAQVGMGYAMEDMKFLFYGHVGAGLTIFIVTVARLFFRFRAAALPGRPATISPIQWKAAKAGHAALYAFLIIMPVTGIMDALKIKIFGELHATLAVLFLVLIAGHVAMAAKHWFFDREDVLGRII